MELLPQYSNNNKLQGAGSRDLHSGPTPTADWFQEPLLYAVMHYERSFNFCVHQNIQVLKFQTYTAYTWEGIRKRAS